MISKEKLLRGYVNTKDKEIKKEWYKACEYYGFNMEYCDFEWDRLDASCVSNGAVHFCDFSMITSTKNQLTLSDFKPKKTRTEWVKVEDSIFDLRPDFEGGELYYKNGSEYIAIETLVQLVSSLEYDNCYRKVEKEIDWRVEATNFISNNETEEVEYTWSVDGVELSDIDFIKLCHLVAELTDKPE